MKMCEVHKVFRFTFVVEMVYPSKTKANAKQRKRLWENSRTMVVLGDPPVAKEVQEWGILRNVGNVCWGVCCRLGPGCWGHFCISDMAKHVDGLHRE